MAADEATGESGSKHEPKAQAKRAKIIVAATVALVVLTIYMIYKSKKSAASASASGVQPSSYPVGSGGSGSSNSGLAGQISSLTHQINRLSKTIGKSNAPVTAAPKASVPTPTQGNGNTGQHWFKGVGITAGELAKIWGVPISALRHYSYSAGHATAVAPTSANQVLSGHVYTQHTRVGSSAHPSYPTTPMVVGGKAGTHPAMHAPQLTPFMHPGVKLAKKG